MSALYVTMMGTIHILVCAFLYVIKKYEAHLGDNVFLMMLLVPVAGPICVIVLLAENRTKHLGSRKIDIFDGEDVMDKYARIHSCNEDIVDVVPFEEAVELNTPALRHDLMFDVLWKNPDQYVRTLIKAENSKDTEVTHLATTMVNEIVTGYEKRMHLFEDKYIKTNDIAILKEYILCMDEFINTGIHEGKIQEFYERKMHELIMEYKNHSKGRLPGKILLINIKNLLNLGENKMAFNELVEAGKRYAFDERLYILWGQYYYNTGDAESMRLMCDELKDKEIYLSRKGRNWFKFWDKTCGI